MHNFPVAAPGVSRVVYYDLVGNVARKVKRKEGAYDLGVRKKGA